MKKILVLILCLSLFGCSYFYYGGPKTYYCSFTSMRYLPKAEQDEILLLTTVPNRPYKEIGIIQVTGIMQSMIDSVKEKMIKKAREVGADAVINIKSLLYGKWEGTAIVFTENK